MTMPRNSQNPRTNVVERRRTSERHSTLIGGPVGREEEEEGYPLPKKWASVQAAESLKSQMTIEFCDTFANPRQCPSLNVPNGNPQTLRTKVGSDSHDNI